MSLIYAKIIHIARARPAELAAADQAGIRTALFVPLLRDDGSVDGHLVTVDDADLTSGRVALVLGLRDLLATPGKGGDYGVKAGASALLPRP